MTYHHSSIPRPEVVKRVRPDTKGSAPSKVNGSAESSNKPEAMNVDTPAPSIPPRPSNVPTGPRRDEQGSADPGGFLVIDKIACRERWHSDRTDWGKPAPYLMPFVPTPTHVDVPDGTHILSILAMRLISA